MRMFAGSKPLPHHEVLQVVKMEIRMREKYKRTVLANGLWFLANVHLKGKSATRPTAGGYSMTHTAGHHPQLRLVRHLRVHHKNTSC